jgi:4-amino-4-deoxy-L-arabinose transferase-like glycosyltransferase
MAAASFYSIAARLTSVKFAVLPTLLFLTQPIYFGSAFINHKDMPFMAFFTTSVAVGLIAADSFDNGIQKRSDQESSSPGDNPSEIRQSLLNEWRATSDLKRTSFILLIIISIIVMIALILDYIFLPFLLRQVTLAYQGEAAPTISDLFEFFAQDAYKTSLGQYLRKVEAYFFWLRIVLMGLIFIPALLLGRSIFIRTHHQYIRPLMYKYGPLILTGILVGMTSAIRVAGPFAFLLIGGYFFLRHRWRSLPALSLICIVAFLTSYLTWSALWGDPISRYLERMFSSLDFDVHEVFFRAEFIRSDSLPSRYLPELLTIQFTEPVALLFPFGLILSAWAAVQRKIDRNLVIIILIWLLVPFFSQIVFGLNLYGNFRHLIFMTPPILMLAGYAWMRAQVLIRKEALQIILALLILIPGIVHIFRYHPYEVIYYNALVGGVPGATGSYAMDFTCTSYREIMEYLNEEAPEGALIYAWGPYHAAETFARDDLVIRPEGGSETPDFAIVCGRGLMNPNFYAGWDVLYEVVRHGTIMSQVKVQPKP